MEKGKYTLRLDIEIVYPVTTTAHRYFTSLKIMRQWQKRNDLDNNMTCLGYKEFIKNKDGHWEPFTVIGKNILTLSQLYKIIRDFEK